MSLEDDIARVARQRGVEPPAPRLKPQLSNRERIKRLIYITVGMKKAPGDNEIYEDLPAASRRFLQDAPFDIPAEAYAHALLGLGDEQAVMELIREIFDEHRQAGRIEDCQTLMMAAEAEKAGKRFVR